MSSLSVSIISWAGRHENASLIARQVSAVQEEVNVIYSDPDPQLAVQAPGRWIRRPNELFWEDKFKAALDRAGDKGLLIIHADCHCDDWARLVTRCSEVVTSEPELGVWAPKIKGTYWNIASCGIAKIQKSGLVLAAMTDGIVFYLSPRMVERMRKVRYGENKYGWGIDLLFCASAYVMNQLVLIDPSVHVVHPQDRGYKRQEAESSMQNFLQQFSLLEYAQYKVLHSYVELNYKKIRARRNTV